MDPYLQPGRIRKMLDGTKIYRIITTISTCWIPSESQQVFRFLGSFIKNRYNIGIMKQKNNC